MRPRVICVCAVLVLMVVLAVVLGLTRSKKKTTASTASTASTDSFEPTFIAKCEEFPGKSKRNDCRKIWSVFEQAYVGRDPCNVPMEAYDPLIAIVPFEPACNRMMFWSKTKEVVCNITENTDCFVTLGGTLLGSVLDDLTWCGQQGSNETFTTGCPGQSDCENNPVRSFWNRTSAAFADVACGDVTVMLNGYITPPFDPTSFFGSIEVKRFSSPRVKSLNVVLVTQENTTTNCAIDASLKDLKNQILSKSIGYNCTEVTESKIQDWVSSYTLLVKVSTVNGRYCQT